MRVINRWMDKMDHFFAYIAAGTLFLMMFLIFLDVFFRTVFNNPITGTLEITGEYLMVLIVYFGIGYTLKEDSHVRVDFFKRMIPKGLNNVFKLFYNLLAIAALLFLSYSNTLKGIEYVEKNVESTSLLNYPLAPALFIISLGLTIMAIRLIVEIINIVIHFRKNGETGHDLSKDSEEQTLLKKNISKMFLNKEH